MCHGLPGRVYCPASPSEWPLFVCDTCIGAARAFLNALGSHLCEDEVPPPKQEDNVFPCQPASWVWGLYDGTVMMGILSIWMPPRAGADEVVDLPFHTVMLISSPADRLQRSLTGFHFLCMATFYKAAYRLF